MRKQILTIAVMCICLQGHSQLEPQTSPIRYGYFQMLYHTGVYWSRTIYLDDQFDDGYKALEARIGFQSTGNQLWHQYNNYPRYGFGIHYADLVADREDTLVGNPFSVFMFYSAPRVRFGKFSLNTDLSLGLSYASLVHDPLTNPLNDVIASHFNLYFDFNLNLLYTLSDRLGLKAGYGVTHYSNGRIHEPQKGVNNWGWNFGLSYFFVQPGWRSQQNLTQADTQKKPSVRPQYMHLNAPEFNPYRELQLMYAAGVVDHHRLGDMEGVHYYTSSFTADYALIFHPRMALTFGMDALYDGSLAIGIKGIAPEDVTTLQKMYFGSHLGYHFFINRLSIMCNLGTYFLQHSNDRGFWFIRAGGRIRLTDHLYTQVCIKTKNGVRSDWIEWGLATTLKIR